MAQKPVLLPDQVYEQLLRKGALDPNEDFISFSFPLNRPDEYWRVGEDEDKTFTAFTDNQILWATRAIRLWEDIIGIKFIDKGHSGDAYIRFFNTYKGYDDDSTGHTYPPWSNHHSGDIWIHASKPDNFSLGYGLAAVGTLIHEIGHALGLAHPGDYDASDAEQPAYPDDADYFQDSKQYTIMSYFAEEWTGGIHRSSPQTPMLHDIYALQTHYGANLATRTGNTVYGFNSNAGNPVYDFNVNREPALAIWDAGGTDTLDLSDSSNDDKIDLGPGRFTSALGGKYNIAIAYNCWIEKAKGGTGDDTITGNTRDNVMAGNDGYDVLYGIDGDDGLSGGGSGDFLYGGGGDDELDGGSGNDFVDASTGDDTLAGGSGNDTLSGHSGLDQFDGGSGLDVASYEYSNSSWSVDLAPDNGLAPIATGNGSFELLFDIEGVMMGGGDDTVYGSDGDNVMKGGGGNDRLYGYLGDDTIVGGPGDDRLYRRDGDNRVDGGAGIDFADYGATSYAITVDLNSAASQRVVNEAGASNDQTDIITGIENLSATVHDDDVAGNASANSFDGSSGDDVLDGKKGNDSLFGGFGNDTLEGGTGNDTLTGGSGFDIVTYDDRWAGVTVTTADGSHYDKYRGTDKFNGIEGLIGSDYGDSLGGNSGYNELYGGRRNDALDGFGGADLLRGGDGDDTIDGGSGDDTIWGQDGDDVLTGSTGDDEIAGWDGQDMVDYAGSTGFVRVDLDIVGQQEVGYTEGTDWLIEIEHAAGSSLGDRLRGTSDANKLYGLGGDDVLEGRGGNDILDGGMGSDTVSYESASVGVLVNLANTLPQNTRAGIDSFISIENVDGSSHADILTGNFLDNYVRGRDGDDWLLGGDGDDWIGGGDGDDLIFADFDDDILTGEDGSDTASFLLATAGVTVSIATNAEQDLGVMGTDRLYFFENLAGSAFDDTLTGNLSANLLEGYGGADVITASGGDDTILAGDGSDTVSSGSGEDIMTGGGGSDVFAFAGPADSSASPSLWDIITDFATAADRIDLAAIDANVALPGHQPLSFIGAAAFSAAGQVRFAQSVEDNRTIVAVNLQGTSIGEMRIQLDGIVPLSAGEFIL